jgi:hypothetical protein
LRARLEAVAPRWLDHFEVQRYDGWYRHITLSLLAHTFLAELRRAARSSVM